MAIELQNCVFLHVPKTGGRWVRRMLERHVQGWKYMGDPIMDAHTWRADFKPIDSDKPAFAFVRHPVTWAESLWNHRAHKQKSHDSNWNWQEYVPVEKLAVGCESLDMWMMKARFVPNIIGNSYIWYTTRVPDVIWGKQENLALDLCWVLRHFNETFNEDAIMTEDKKKVGTGYYTDRVSRNAAKHVVWESEEALCLKYGYTLEELGYE